MLNELSQVVEAMARQGVATPPRHRRITPMGKNSELLIVGIADNAVPTNIEIMPADKAQHLFRIEHGAAGSSFPGFNIPVPLQMFNEEPVEKLKIVVEQFLSLAKNKKSANSELIASISSLFALSSPRVFTNMQANSFKRSCEELVGELQKRFSVVPIRLENFCHLLEVMEKGKPDLSGFSKKLAELLGTSGGNFNRTELLLIAEILFGVMDWKKRKTDIGESDYWHEKARRDNKANQPIYLDLANPISNFKRVAHQDTSKALNDAMMATEISGSTETDSDVGVDAYSGARCKLLEKFPSPKIAELGNLKLYSVNAGEIAALQRYRRKGSQTFPISAILVQKMNDALLYLASDEKCGQTCKAIPSAYPKKRDLLVAYLEGEPPPSEKLAEMFGGEIGSSSDADFSATVRPIIDMLEAKAASNPNLNIRLLSFCSIDKGRKQISLNRQFHVAGLIRATRDWQIGARNVPRVSISIKYIPRDFIVPYPLDLASTINRVWSADSKVGFTAKFQRAFSNSDAYDVFAGDGQLSLRKSQAALGLLVGKMGTVLASLGMVKAICKWENFGEAVRLQLLKTIALLGILLHRLGEKKEGFMQEPITNVGRLLALADSLHLQYCKHVRKGESPSQLIGNALFNTALEQPVVALARLAERLAPYQAWAQTFKSSDPIAGVGLVKYFLSEISSCTASILIKFSEIPSRMQDADKAKLLLGYLADNQKTEKQAGEPKIGEKE
jgi:hypothetical protein